MLLGRRHVVPRFRKWVGGAQDAGQCSCSFPQKACSGRPPAGLPGFATADREVRLCGDLVETLGMDASVWACAIEPRAGGADDQSLQCALRVPFKNLSPPIRFLTFLTTEF